VTVTITHSTGSISAASIESYATTRESKNILHSIIGRNSVEVTTAPAGLRSGSVKFLFLNHTNALTAEALLAKAGTFTLAISEMTGLNMTFVLSGSLTVEQLSEGFEQWTVEVDFQEVADA
jgi:hypothetical protein